MKLFFLLIIWVYFLNSCGWFQKKIDEETQDIGPKPTQLKFLDLGEFTKRSCQEFKLTVITNDGFIQAIENDVTVNLTATEGTIYSDEGCTATATTVLIPKSTSIHGVFYFKNNANKKATITAQDASSTYRSADFEYDTTVNIIATYINTCHSDSDGDMVYEKFTFAEDWTVTWTQNVYASDDSTCTGTKLHTAVLTGKFEIGQQASWTTGITDLARELKYIWDKFEITVHTGSQVTLFNDGSLFGFNDWVVDTTKDVTGLTGPDNLVINMGATSKDIYNEKAIDQYVNGIRFAEVGQTAHPKAYYIYIYLKQ